MWLVLFGGTSENHKYLDMFIAVVLQLQARPDSTELFFQEDGDSPHYSLTVPQYMNKVSPHHSMGDWGALRGHHTFFGLNSNGFIFLRRSTG
ncbi:hypothetical protein TNCV_209361 [Trichonephila clavipes]|uniref:Uncharacterized protein n=1 Tax=Trichonephila clavipes TaxID=2585209 RepID=A0A8X6VS68_TRICX|nr:hypothetical protein TNCV_209361 [Trichonephila clavipes]